jgi:hypothetical protein
MLLFLAVVVIGVVIFVLNRRRQALEAELGIERPTKRQKRPSVPAPQAAVEFSDPRPVVADFHVEGNAARVTFDVPIPTGGDEVLSDLLLGEAIEVVRERRHALPLGNLTEVIAFAGRGDIVEVGRAKLDTPGQLPPKVERSGFLNLAVFARDPLQESFSPTDGDDFHPGTQATERRDELAPLMSELRLPKAVDTGLRTQGIDPDRASAGELVTGVLRLFGYQITPTGIGGWFADKAGERTYIVEDRYQPGNHPELEDHVIRRFMVEFGSSGAERGLLVSEKYAPFEVYGLEKREPRVRFITRERLQKLIDALALS